MNHNSHSSSVSINRRPSNADKFERQIALPTKMENVITSSDQKIIQTADIPQLPPLASSSSSSSSTSSVISLPSVSSSGGSNGFQINVNQKPVSVGQNGFNYNKPNYNDPSFKYNDEHSDSHFYNQFPPSVEEPRNGHGDYYGNVYNNQQATDAYRPTEQRPVVTKTIQIAQPAIKAKKYEVRHPAIQKEFYDIEERVVIKPAGTVVVELERPSAKILKEETTLPLGHPHPAVAAAYKTNRNTPTYSNIIYSNAGSSSTSNHHNNQYVPQNPYNNKNTPDHRSSSNTYNQVSKEVVVDSNQNKQYNGENQYGIAAASNAQKSNNREMVVVTDGQGNQRQVSADQFSYVRDESNKVPLRKGHLPRNSFGYEDSGRISSQINISPQRSESREEFASEAEYINNSGNNNNVRMESKPARIQEASSKFSNEQQHTQPIIKHEHKIVLSPSQHNIYLNSNQEVPKTKFIEEPAHVREMSPYLQNQRGPVIVYASAKKNTEVPYSQRSEYQTKFTTSSQVARLRDSPRVAESRISNNRVQYNAPYAQMRHIPDSHFVEQQNRLQKNIGTQRISEKLILKEKSTMNEEKFSEKGVMDKPAPHAHIHIKIPQQPSHDPDKAIVINSTIRPVMMNDDRNQMHNSKLEISVTNNGESREQQHQTSNESFKMSNEKKHLDNDNYNTNNNGGTNTDENDAEHLSNLKIEDDCKKPTSSAQSENYKLSSDLNNNKQSQYKFMRIVESSGDATTSSANEGSSAIETSANQLHNVDVNLKSSVGNISPTGSRVLSATPAPKEAIPNESFHKRRIVVNHPFQTVREVVEHEPYTKYHEVQVNEPATPSLYHSANYFQSY